MEKKKINNRTEIKIALKDQFVERVPHIYIYIFAAAAQKFKSDLWPFTEWPPLVSQRKKWMNKMES